MNKKVCDYFEHNLNVTEFQILVLNIEPATLKSFGAQNLGLFSSKGQPVDSLHVVPFERVVFGYPHLDQVKDKKLKFDYALVPILQSINVASNILGGDPEVLQISAKTKKSDIGGLEVKNDSAQTFNCFIKIIDHQFAFAIILESKVPMPVGYYARSAL